MVPKSKQDSSSKEFNEADIVRCCMIVKTSWSPANIMKNLSTRHPIEYGELKEDADIQYSMYFY